MRGYYLCFLFVSVVKYYGCPDFCSCCGEYYTLKNFDKIINGAIEEYKKGEFLNKYNDNKDLITLENFPVTINGLKINEIKKEDVIKNCSLVQENVACIVNAANYGFSGGGGIDGIIKNNFEYTCDEEKKNLKDGSPDFIGKSIYTPCKKKKKSRASDLIEGIIHTVAPDVSMVFKSEKYINQFYSCFDNIFDLCVKKNIKSIAFQLVGCGVFGWKLEDFALGFFHGYIKNFKKCDVLKDVKINICVYKPGNRNSIMPNTSMTVYFLACCFIKIFEDLNKTIDPLF